MKIGEDNKRGNGGKKSGAAAKKLSKTLEGTKLRSDRIPACTLVKCARAYLTPSRDNIGNPIQGAGGSKRGRSVEEKNARGGSNVCYAGEGQVTKSKEEAEGREQVCKGGGPSGG